MSLPSKWESVKKKFSRGPTPRLEPEQSFPHENCLARGRQRASHPGLIPAYTLHGLILESDPIFPKAPGSGCPLSGQHIPTLEIKI